MNYRCGGDSRTGIRRGNHKGMPEWLQSHDETLIVEELLLAMRKESGFLK